jgi:hypothetical protein
MNPGGVGEQHPPSQRDGTIKRPLADRLSHSRILAEIIPT